MPGICLSVFALGIGEKSILKLRPQLTVGAKPESSAQQR
jgi:hypothetical protein